MKRLLILMAVCALALSAHPAAAEDAVKAEAAAAAAMVKEDKAITAIEKQTAGVNTSVDGWRTQIAKPEVVEFDENHEYFLNMKTNKGPVLIKFMPETAPMHVTSMIYLTKLGFYDGLTFHRVINQFMAQGGCPLHNGTGGPGYKYAGEFDPTVKHDRPGLLSMANAGPGTDGSQFFLTFVPTPWLDGKHTIFGEVVEGMETLKALEAVGSRSGKTSEPVGMEVVTVEVRAKS